MKLNENMGFVYISEQTSPTDYKPSNLVVHDKNGVFYVEFESALHSFDVINRNSRQYKGPNIMKCLETERIQSYLKHGGWYGEMDHPASHYKDKPLSPERVQTIDMNNTSHRLLNPHQSGNLLISTVQSDAGTDAGLNLARKMVQGFIPEFSCRAIASLGIENGKPTVTANKVIAYDWVLFPSHKEAGQIMSTATKFVTKAVDTVTEGVKELVIPLKEILESVGRKDVNAQIIMESFDLSTDNMMGFSANNEHLIVKDDNNMIYCNIDPTTRKNVNDFFASFN